MSVTAVHVVLDEDVSVRRVFGEDKTSQPVARRNLVAINYSYGPTFSYVRLQADPRYGLKDSWQELGFKGECPLPVPSSEDVRDDGPRDEVLVLEVLVLEVLVLEVLVLEVLEVLEVLVLASVRSTVF
ncbi:uncharacterized protein CIMG_07670 [Coccidioides immitis RS]|uniref:Uncharacterized protein n=1 Tax=Coccidioides immitis (strain RS) TaxID=246410 RepID=A0A0E1RV21_COCIM|nr:uncharacterized protein CIMG_07670 [Coccidioides immitis RS]EAS28924.2 hypothetical protein CIMG_07670 [Coccidioides immitis RS]